MFPKDGVVVGQKNIIAHDLAFLEGVGEKSKSIARARSIHIYLTNIDLMNLDVGHYSREGF